MEDQFAIIHRRHIWVINQTLKRVSKKRKYGCCKESAYKKLIWPFTCYALFLKDGCLNRAKQYVRLPQMNNQVHQYSAPS